MKTFEERFWDKVNRTPGQGPNGDCWEWTRGKNEAGYGRVNVDGKNCHAHRIAFLLYNGYLPEPGRIVMHSCDNPACCNPAHLSDGTHARNTQDKVQKGRARNGSRTHPECLARGERNGRSKLTWAEVCEMRALYATGNWTQPELAHKYRTCHSNVSDIVNWRLRKVA